MKYIKWRINYNRPLSREERDIAERISTDPPLVVKAAQSWHSPLVTRKAHEGVPQEEEA